MGREPTPGERLLFLVSRGLPVPNQANVTPPRDGRAPRASEPAALGRVRGQIARLKEWSFVTYARAATGRGKARFVAEGVGGWRDLTELGRLAVLDHWVDWDGVSLPDRRAELLHEIDTSKLPPEVARQLHPVPRESVFDRAARRAAGRPKARGRGHEYEPER